ncbi:MAG: ribonuclease P protein component [Clostridia bacterium]|nr:ribonuclease P protein component [Clostridia bacterium]
MKETVLRQNTQFRTLYYRGATRADKLIIVFARKNHLPYTRTGITTGKKVGNAVKRSRARRVIRAAYRELAPAVKTGYDLVFVARTATAFCKSGEVTAALRRVLCELDVIDG